MRWNQPEGQGWGRIWSEVGELEYFRQRKQHIWNTWSKKDAIPSPSWIHLLSSTSTCTISIKSSSSFFSNQANRKFFFTSCTSGSELYILFFSFLFCFSDCIGDLSISLHRMNILFFYNHEIFQCMAVP